MIHYGLNMKDPIKFQSGIIKKKNKQNSWNNEQSDKKKPRTKQIEAIQKIQLIGTKSVN